MAILQDLENRVNELGTQREGAYGEVQGATAELGKTSNEGLTFGDKLKEAIMKKAAEQSPLYKRNAEAKANYRTFLGTELPKLKGTFNSESEILGAVDAARNTKLQDIFHTQNLLDAQQTRLEDIIPTASNAYQANYVQPLAQRLAAAQQNYDYLNSLVGEATSNYQFEANQAQQRALAAMSRAPSSKPEDNTEKVLATLQEEAGYEATDPTTGVTDPAKYQDYIFRQINSGRFNGVEGVDVNRLKNAWMGLPWVQQNVTWQTNWNDGSVTPPIVQPQGNNEPVVAPDNTVYSTLLQRITSGTDNPGALGQPAMGAMELLGLANNNPVYANIYGIR